MVARVRNVTEKGKEVGVVAYHSINPTYRAVARLPHMQEFSAGTEFSQLTELGFEPKMTISATAVFPFTLLCHKKQVPSKFLLNEISDSTSPMQTIKSTIPFGFSYVPRPSVYRISHYIPTLDRCFGTPKGIRTPASGVKGQRLEPT